jgi:hypothetical protein
LAEYRTLYNLDRFMTLHATITGAEPTDPPAAQAAQRPLVAGNIVGFSCNEVVLSLGVDDLSPMTKVDLPGIASKEAAVRVKLHSPAVVWGIAGWGIAERNAAPESFIGFPMMLNQRGMRRLIAGRFEASDPDIITTGRDPYLIRRPERRGQRPGILERSRSRPLTHPSVERGVA